MVSWLPLPVNSAEAAAEASFRTVTCQQPKINRQAALSHGIGVGVSTSTRSDTTVVMPHWCLSYG